MYTPVIKFLFFDVGEKYGKTDITIVREPNKVFKDWELTQKGEKYTFETYFNQVVEKLDHEKLEEQENRIINIQLDDAEKFKTFDLAKVISDLPILNAELSSPNYEIIIAKPVENDNWIKLKCFYHFSKEHSLHLQHIFDIIDCTKDINLWYYGLNFKTNEPEIINELYIGFRKKDGFLEFYDTKNIEEPFFKQFSIQQLLEEKDKRRSERLKESEEARKEKEFDESLSSDSYNFRDEYYNDNLDMDQQDPEFWNY